MQGKTISVGSSNGLAAIDTGTTLIGAPTSIAASIWSQVPGSMELTGQYQGLYAFRQCQLRNARWAEYSSTSSLRHYCHNLHVFRWNQLGYQSSGHEPRHHQCFNERDRCCHFSNVCWRYLRYRHHHWRWFWCTFLDCR